MKLKHCWINGVFVIIIYLLIIMKVFKEELTF